MKRCVKKRLAMFLAAATLVTSAGLSSGLTSLAETVSSNARNSVRREASATDSDATDNDADKKPTPSPTQTPEETEKPNQTPGAEELPKDDATITETGKVESAAKEAGVQEVKHADTIKDLKVDVPANPAIPSTVKTNSSFVQWLKANVLNVIKEELAEVNIEKADVSTLKQFDISAAEGSKGKISLTFNAEYQKKFNGKETVVLHRHNKNDKWKKVSARWTITGKLEIDMPNFSEVMIFAAEKKDATATPSIPSRGSSSTRGSNSSSGKATVTNEVNTTTLTGTWKRDAKGWWFQTTGGGYPRNRWGIINGKWFFFGNDGYMKTGWVQSNGAWYYCNPDASNGVEGEMKTGWIVDNGKWFYLGRTGAMETGWVQVNGVYYYLNPVSDGSRGAMAVNTWIGNYYVGADGAWQQNKTR